MKGGRSVLTGRRRLSTTHSTKFSLGGQSSLKKGVSDEGKRER